MNDPIVASVRTVRDGLAAAFGYDVHVIFADLCAGRKLNWVTGS